jgi:hypothetical protein
MAHAESIPEPPQGFPDQANLLLRNGFPHTLICVSERPEYLAALDEANLGKTERFARFILNSIER